MKYINDIARCVEVFYKNYPGVAWLIGLVIALLSVIGVYYFNIIEVATSNQKEDILNGEWNFVRNDSDTNNMGESIRIQRVWSGDFESKDGVITGRLTKQTTNKSGKIETQKIEGIVFGILRAELLSISYGSKDIEGPGVGAWILKRTRDGEKNFVGQAIGYDCDQGKVTRCPALLTKNTEFAVNKYINYLNEPCLDIPLSEEQVKNLNREGKIIGTTEKSECPK